MAVKLGHASINEKGTVKGGKKGDQTGKEVTIRNWYLHKKGWVVIRPKNSEDAEIISSTMEKICQNDCFGYGQDYRDSGFNELKKVNFDPKKVKVKCGLDCSKAVMACCWAAGIKVDNFVTKTQISILKATGKFTILTSDKYCKSSDWLKRGDILVTAKTPGHTVVILSDGAEVIKANNKKPDNNKSEKKPETNNNKKYNEAKVKVAKYFNKTIAGTYVTKTNLNLRYGAGTINEKIITMPKGAKIRCYGYYNKHLGTNWYLVEYGDYVGYCSSSSKYLKKSN